MPGSSGAFQSAAKAALLGSPETWEEWEATLPAGSNYFHIIIPFYGKGSAHDPAAKVMVTEFHQRICSLKTSRANCMGGWVRLENCGMERALRLGLQRGPCSAYSRGDRAYSWLAALVAPPSHAVVLAATSSAMKKNQVTNAVHSPAQTNVSCTSKHAPAPAHSLATQHQKQESAKSAASTADIAQFGMSRARRKQPESAFRRYVPGSSAMTSTAAQSAGGEGSSACGAGLLFSPPLRLDDTCEPPHAEDLGPVGGSTLYGSDGSERPLFPIAFDEPDAPGVANSGTRQPSGADPTGETWPWSGDLVGEWPRRTAGGVAGLLGGDGSGADPDEGVSSYDADWGSGPPGCDLPPPFGHGHSGTAGPESSCAGRNIASGDWLGGDLAVPTQPDQPRQPLPATPELISRPAAAVAAVAPNATTAGGLRGRCRPPLLEGGLRERGVA